VDHLLELLLDEPVVLLLLGSFVLDKHEVVGQHLVEEFSQIEEVGEFGSDVGEGRLQGVEFSLAVQNPQVDSPAGLLALPELLQQPALLYLQVGQVATHQARVQLEHHLIQFWVFALRGLRG